jgi:uncharacterized protein YfaS (alpha-2-macroglobulin family)
MSWLSTFIVSVFFVVNLFADQIQTADQKFKDKLYNEAAKIYEQEIKKDYFAKLSPEVEEAVLIKWVQSLILSGKYEKALLELGKIKINSKSKNYPFYLTLKAKTFENYLNQYRYQMQQQEIEGDKSVVNKTPEFFESEIQQASQELWNQRAEYKKIDISSSVILFNTKDSDTETMPTFYDFIIGQFLQNYRWQKVKKFNIETMLKEAAMADSNSNRTYIKEKWLIELKKREWNIASYVNYQFEDSEEPNSSLKNPNFEKINSFISELKTPRAQSEWYLIMAKNEILAEGFEKAYANCDRALNLFKSIISAECIEIQRMIVNKEINFRHSVFTTQQEFALSVKTRNLKKLYFRLYDSNNNYDMSKLFNDFKSQKLSYLDKDKIKQWLSEKAIYESTMEIKETVKHQYVTNKIVLPKKDSGRYVILVSDKSNFSFEESFIAGTNVWISDLVMLMQTGIDYNSEKSIALTEIMNLTSYHFYYFNAITGKLEKNVNLLTSLNYKDAKELKNQDGYSSVKDDWDFTAQNRLGYGFHLFSLAYKGKDFSFVNGYLAKGHQQRVNIFIEKDRPIYRPGQKIHLKFIALKRVPFGWDVMPRQKLTINIKDANYKLVQTKEVVLNEMGSASSSFDIPQTGLLGNYFIEALLQNQDPVLSNVQKSFTQNFRVEEYKRPDFFIEIPKDQSTWVFNKPVKIKVKAKYYHGSPVKKSFVSYTINKQVYWPWYYRSYIYQDSVTSADSAEAGSQAVGQGETDDNGEFEISYLPSAKKDVSPQRYELNVSVRDAGGRSISESQSFYASASEFLIQLTTLKNFYFEEDVLKIQTDLKDLNDQKYSGIVTATISEIQPPSTEQIQKFKKESMDDSGGGGYPGARYRSYYPVPREKDLIYYLKDLVKKEIQTKSVKIDKSQVSSVEFSKLKEGFYYIKVQAKDSKETKVENELYVMVFSNGEKISKYYQPKVLLTERKSYKVGDNVKAVFGSSELLGDAIVNVVKNSFLGYSKTFTNKEKFKLVQFKAEEQYQRDVSLNWFGISEKSIIQEHQVIDIEPLDKKLSLKLDYKKELKPGQKQILQIKSDGESQNILEGLLRVYDQSLEYYAKDDTDKYNELYHDDTITSMAQKYEFYSQTMIVPEKTDIFTAMIELFRKKVNIKSQPFLYIDRQAFESDGIHMRGMGGRGAMLGADSMNAMMPAAAPAEASFEQSERLMSKTKGALKESSDVSSQLADKKSEEKSESKSNESEAKVEVRSNFSETAVFEPMIKFQNGKAKIEFKLPDQLTTWKMKALVVSKNGKVGEETGTFMTNKSLMAKIQVPRFFREKDSSEIRVQVENKSKLELSGSLKLTLEQEGKNVYKEFSSEQNSKTWKLKPGDQVSIAWKIQVPSNLQDLKIKAIALAGSESDAEEKVLPILPSRERFIESQISFLKDNKKTKLEFPKWKEEDKSRKHELLAVQIDPQLPLMLLNSMPGLINYPYSCSEQLINKYVPLAILTSLYDKNPKLKEALKKVPERTTINLPWEQNDPRRLISLMETPWLQISEGLKSSYDLIQLMDADKIAKIKNYVFSELSSRQLPSGGFTWFSGGREDLYITLILLEGFSEALKYGVDIPRPMIEKALDYVYKELPKYLKAEKHELQFLVYGSYVFSSFDSVNLKMSRNAEALKSWLPFIEKYEDLITPLGQAYLANIYHKMGKKDKSDLALKKAFDGMKTDPLIGSYWAPEEKSWMWYSDTIEKHAFFIQTLVELKPKDERIKGLVQWLLFNRKGNEWKSTKSSAKAVYSVLRYMTSAGALDKPTNIDMQWGDLKEDIKIDPFDFNKEPLRFIKKENITHKDGTVEFMKRGALPVIASSTWIYTSDKISSGSVSSVLSLERSFYAVKGNPMKQTLELLKNETKVKVGDEIEVQLRIKAKSQLEYIHLKDPRGAGFESTTLLSGHFWDVISRYEEPRDSLTNFFISWLPQGEYTLKHRFKATTVGKYKFGSAVIQSMYSPDMSAYSAGMVVEVE